MKGRLAGFNILRSFQVRLLFILMFISMLPAFLIGELAKSYIEISFVDVKMNRLMSQCNILRNHIQKEKYISHGDTAGVDVEIESLASALDGRILIMDDSLNVLKDSSNMYTGKACITAMVVKCYSNQREIYKYQKNHQCIELAVPLTNSEGNLCAGVLYGTFSTNDVEKPLDYIRSVLRIVEIILSIVNYVLLLWLVRRTMKPFQVISESVEKITAGNFDEGVSFSNYTEIKQVERAINTMIEKIQELEATRQEFVSNVSHELKTPITSMRVLADSMLMMGEVPNEMYKEFFQDIVSEVDRENDIITDLLALVKMDKKDSPLNFTTVNLNEMVEGILRRVRPIAEKDNIELVLESYREIQAEVDELKMSSAITNLVENAVKYNVTDGWVHVSLDSDFKFFYIKVADSGIGIPEEEKDKVFERFYRVDKARSRETGGTGLGLAITKSVINRHNGSIFMTSNMGEGTTFTVRVPLNPIVEEKRKDS